MLCVSFVWVCLIYVLIDLPGSLASFGLFPCRQMVSPGSRSPRSSLRFVALKISDHLADTWGWCEWRRKPVVFSMDALLQVSLLGVA